MDMPFRKAKSSYTKLGNKIKPFNKFMNMGLIEPATNQDMEEYIEQMGSSAPYMKNIEEGESFDVSGNEEERSDYNVFDIGKNDDPMRGDFDYSTKTTKKEAKEKYSSQAKKRLKG